MGAGAGAGAVSFSLGKRQEVLGMALMAARQRERG